MTKRSPHGTLSTRGNADKKKERDVLGKARELIGKKRYHFHPHANERMGQRGVIFYEVLQVLGSGVHRPAKDRFSRTHETWEYSIEGKTLDKRSLVVGISFENDKSGERLLVITVIDPKK